MFAALRAASLKPAVSTTLNASRALSTSAAVRDISRLTVVGRVVGVSDARQTANGSEFVAYTVATNDPVIREQEPTSTFHRIYAFGNSNVERIAKIGKGDLVYVEADLRIERVAPTEDQPATERVLTSHRSSRNPPPPNPPTRSWLRVPQCDLRR